MFNEFNVFCSAALHRTSGCFIKAFYLCLFSFMTLNISGCNHKESKNTVSVDTGNIAEPVKQDNIGNTLAEARTKSENQKLTPEKLPDTKDNENPPQTPFDKGGKKGGFRDETAINKNQQPVPKKAQESNAIQESAKKIKVTFVELGSVGCIPCKMMQPIMKEIEEEYKGQVKVVFYDVWTEEGRPYAEKYGIRVIPTQVFLDENGVEFFRHEGFFPKEELVKILKSQGVE